MLVYNSTKTTFIDHVRRNEIADRVLDAMRSHGQGSVSPSEWRSWEESLQRMKNVLEDDDIPHDVGIAIEYRIPQTSKRVDMIISGLDEQRRESCVIVELKQWGSVEVTNKDAIVRTVVGGPGGPRETTHPSYQAWSYAALLKDFNQTVQEEKIRLEPCAYLHNCRDGSGVGVTDSRYDEHLKRAPVFLNRDMERLQEFIREHVRHGDTTRLLYRIEHGRIRPSRELADSLASLLKGNHDFLMIDDQKLVYEMALEVASIAQQGEKQVLIVEGGPGTGKSVVAINLLVELTKRYQTVHYVTPNRAPRQVYEGRLTGTMTKTRFSNLFKGSASYDGTEENALDALVVDEAHRLLERAQFQKTGTNQVRDIIRASRTSVFFVDEAQRIKWNDIGTPGEIEAWAKNQNATIHRAVLQSQFRCNGSDGYLAWLDRVLGLHDSAQDDLSGIGYHLEVLESPSALRRRIVELDQAGEKARLVAGYCWNWVSQQNSEPYDIVFPDDGFAMQWNLFPDEGRYLEKDYSIDQVGCIHTVQGLEMDYVGVIIGPDLIVRNGRVITQPEKRAKTDHSLHGYKKARKQYPEEADARADAIIKNTYRTLMSRGLKGCLIYCTDAETQEYFRAQIALAFAEDEPEPTTESAVANEPETEETTTQPEEGVWFLSAEEVGDDDNAVPFIDLPVAAGDFAEGFAEIQNPRQAQTWIALPDMYRAKPGLFAVRVDGESMNRRIPSGSLCLFEANPGGSRNGRAMLVYHRDIQDPDHGGALTVKMYHSEKVPNPDHEWEHRRIVLACDTLAPGYEDIVLDEAQAGELQVLGEFKGTLEQ